MRILVLSLFNMKNRPSFQIASNYFKFTALLDTSLGHQFRHMLKMMGDLSLYGGV